MTMQHFVGFVVGWVSACGVACWLVNRQFNSLKRTVHALKGRLPPP